MERGDATVSLIAVALFASFAVGLSVGYAAGHLRGAEETAANCDRYGAFYVRDQRYTCRPVPGRFRELRPGGVR